MIQLELNFVKGRFRLDGFPSVEDLIKKCLSLLCDSADAERHFVNFESDDSVVLVLNNYGGISNLELGALTDEILTQLCMIDTHQPFSF